MVRIFFKPVDPKNNLLNYCNLHIAVDPLIVCPQGFLPKAKGMNSSNTNLYNIIKRGLWKWTEDYVESNNDENHPNAREDEDCLVLNINTPKVLTDLSRIVLLIKHTNISFFHRFQPKEKI
jgi:hypothetical protein